MMKITNIIMNIATMAVLLFLAGSAIAAPGTAMGQARTVGRAHSKTLQLLPSQYLQAAKVKLAVETNRTDVSNNTIWAGAILVSPTIIPRCSYKVVGAIKSNMQTAGKSRWNSLRHRHIPRPHSFYQRYRKCLGRH